ncbi:SDR family oxidoreductase [Polyangium spumosum]|uniref:SDR family NAD(P)-dependent oxidoreductase n=1 Tax=Polyangium spumosum TaxID=889282 RepID=A0A6N7PMA1_9BACT|nr:SDR family oxidoreductase [Polyangium spumosum]MRG91205.1 SDR family NAD(P)-dependent oxidoreductase [Polyangium spumosum]
MRIVITGANRGIGLELARRYLDRGDHVDAAVRNPEAARELAALGRGAGGRLRILTCDVGDDTSVRTFATALGDVAVDVLINNAGILGKWVSLADLDFADVTRTVDTNAVGPLRVTAALLPHLRRSSMRKIVNMSSRMGSIAENTDGGAYAYRMSKAALNMANKSMSLDLRGEGFTVVVLHPDWVKTDMGGPDAPISVEESAAGIVALVDRLTIADTGGFFHFRGHTLPW